ncbi:MAG: HlyD family efflux transporter periplasmic adaptor subunit [Bacteroidota bacterium]
MLNISQNRISRDFEKERYYAFQEVLYIPLARSLAYWLVGILFGFVVLLFFPWTQNIAAKGNLTALQPNQRPQTIESTIDGRIERWYVSEGDTVQPGDTIVFLSEIKDDYFDPDLVPRTESRALAKENSAVSYQQKAKALADQAEFLMSIMELKVDQLTNKVEQSELKVVSDSIDLVAADIALEIAEIQLARWDSLYNKVGSKSRTEFEEKRNKQQKAQADRLSQSNKLDIARRELINARIELRNVRNEYQEKIAKARSDRQSALSSQFDSEASATKLRIEAANYGQRVDFRYITAPQRGFVNRALKPGIGETVKAGEPVVSILPLDYDLAAELFVRPVDLPLMRKGEKVRLEFDGWPAIVFSGWPNTSFGTFGGIVFAVETNISSNGLYRVLIAPDPDDEVWPDLLRPGAGTNGFALLDEVPLWYEIWRQLNGFPPNFYIEDSGKSSSAGGKDGDSSKK